MVIATVMLCQYLGPSGLAGILIMLLSMPLNGFIVKKLGAFTRKTMILRDKRVKFTTELLQAPYRIDSIVKYSMVLYSTVQYSTVQYSMVWYSTL